MPSLQPRTGDNAEVREARMLRENSQFAPSTNKRFRENKRPRRKSQPFLCFLARANPWPPLVPRSPATTSTTARPAAATTSTTTPARSTTPPAIAAAVRTISMRTIPSYRRNRLSVPVEVRFVVRKIPAAFDGQSGSPNRFAVTLLAALNSRLASAHFRALLLKNRLPRKPDAIALNRKHFHQHLIAFLQFIANILNAMLGDFADVQQPVGAWDNLDKCAEIRQPRHRAKISLAHFGGRRQIANDLQRFIRGSLVVRSHVDFAGIFNVDLHSGLFDNGANHFATGPNHVANLIDGNLESVNSRRISRDFLAMLGNPLAHLVEDMQSAALRLSQSLPHNLSGNAADFDVHLQSGDAVFGPGDFKIHVAVVIFRAGDVGQDGVIVAFLHQPHSHASHGRFQRNASIHQRK